MAIKKNTKVNVPKKKVAPVKKVTKPAVVKNPVATLVKKEVAIISSPFWNIWDAGNQYKVRVSIPGLTKKNIKVHVVGNKLTISSEKQTETKTEKKNYLIQEYSFDSWSKTIALPQKIKEEDVKISYKDGLLKIGLKKV
jgi:HSP20 family molecular chaperone IbpA